MPVDLDVGGGDACRALHGAVVAQQLLDRGGDQRGIVPHARELVGVAQQRQGAVADQVDGRLVARDEQQQAHRDDLVDGELVALLLGGQEAREKVGLRPGPALHDQRAEIVGQRPAGAAPALDDGRIRRQPDRVEAARDVGRPAADRRVIVHRHAQHLADDRHRQRVGEVLDDVHAVLPGHAVEQAVDDLLDVRAHRLDHARRERLADQRAQPRMIGRVAEEHRAREGRLLRLVAVDRGEHLLELLASEARVAQDVDAVVVARQHPESQRAVVDRLLLAQPPIERVRVGVELRQQRIEQELVAAGHGQRASTSRSASAGCLARRPARCWICWRQEMPGAITSVVGGAALTAGASRRFPSATETS